MERRGTVVERAARKSGRVTASSERSVILRESFQLAVEKRQRILQVLPVARARARVQIMQNACTGKQQTVALALDLALLGGQHLLCRALIQRRIFPLRLDGLTFPAPGHISKYRHRRANAPVCGRMKDEG
jgi:hypothetical protein